MEGAERFERAYFEKSYRDYARQNPGYKLRFYRALAERSVGGIDSPRILDLACAFGAFLASLPPGWQCFGLDVSEFALVRARRILPDARLALSSMTDIPFDELMDVVTAFDVLEHVPDLERSAQAVRASLAPHGRFIFVVPVYDGPTGLLVRMLDRDETHIHKRSRRFWLDWAGRHFNVEAWWGIYRILPPLGSYVHWPTLRLRRFAPAIAVVAALQGASPP
jgi:SAM-dependent methyltransferase